MRWRASRTSTGGAAARNRAGRRPVAILLLAVIAAVVATAVAASATGATAAPNDGRIIAVGAENEYADVIGQVGGEYVQATAIMSNPNTDPHSFEASIAVAREVGNAQLVVQNGIGYDDFMNSIESASPNSGRTVINVQQLLKLPDSTPNPHLWYSPATMPAVAKAVASDLASIQPSHASYFRARAAAFDTSLQPWYQALATFKAAHPGTPVAVTEPVGDYMLQAAGARILTPFGFQADVMNGVDLSPQFVALEDNLFAQHKVKVFLYNQQVTDALTASFLANAHKYGIPVVGVYETMPTGYTYQSWMLAEVHALQRAVADHVSTQKLGS